MSYGPAPRPLADRFHEKYTPEPNTGCWLWTASLNNGGYGKLSVSRSYWVEAHRVAYELYKGPIPGGKCIDHLCRVRSCVNPDHLEAVTLSENIRRGKGPAILKAYWAKKLGDITT
jgi:hypothetical protein